jgi:hypothetical protein
LRPEGARDTREGGTCEGASHVAACVGFDIVANFGDQFSDLNGGFSDKTFKMPNPNYFLP